MSRVYLDSNILAYHFDFHPVFGDTASAVLQADLRPGNRLFSSNYALSEVLVKPVMLDEEFKAALVRRYFSSAAMTMLKYPDAAIPIYTRLRAEHRVKPFDALHLACAAHAGVDLCLTNDLQLTRLTVPGIGSIAGLDTQF